MNNTLLCVLSAAASQVIIIGWVGVELFKEEEEWRKREELSVYSSSLSSLSSPEESSSRPW
jgi:hypothetical protein